MFDTSLLLLKRINGRGCFDIDLKYLKLKCDIVRMILSGDKTQIRVFVKQSNNQDEDSKDQYEAGDVIAVKETWAVKDGEYIYKADYDNNYSNTLWVQSTRMPDDAVRLFLRVVSARKEELQDISPEKKVVLTDEQIEASKARLERGRQKRLSMIGDDAHVGLERSKIDEQW